MRSAARQALGYAAEAPGPLPPALYRLLDPNLSVDLPPAHKVRLLQHTFICLPALACALHSAAAHLVCIARLLHVEWVSVCACAPRQAARGLQASQLLYWEVGAVT